MAYVSDCCHAAPTFTEDNDSMDSGICPRCKEHCTFLDEDEIPYPRFYECAGVNKVLSKESGINVLDDDTELTVQYFKNCLPEIIEKQGTPIPEFVFNNRLQKALTALNQLIQHEPKLGEMPVVKMEDVSFVNDPDDLKHVNI